MSNKALIYLGKRTLTIEELIRVTIDECNPKSIEDKD